MERPDVVIIGAGLIGLGIAWRASQRGLRVTLLDPDPQRSASRVGAGLLIPAGTHLSRGHLQLRQESAHRYPGFVRQLQEETGLCSGYRDCGMLTVALGASASTAVAGLAGRLRGLGLPHEEVTGEQCRELERGLAEVVGAGLLTPDHQVDPERLLAALEAACRGRGVHYQRVRAVAARPGQVVLEDRTRLDTGQVVVAAGAWTGELSREPVRPVKGQVLQLRGEPDFLTRNLHVQPHDLYVANRGDGRLAIGATEEEAGFDRRPTAGAARELLERCLEVLPGLADFELVDSRAGLRPRVSHGLPVLGWCSDGLLLATGHYRNGILLTPVTADVVADMLATGETPDWIRSFAPGKGATPEA